MSRAVLARTSQKLAAQRPKVRGDEHELLDVDLVVMAMGYRSDPAFAATLPGTPVARVAKSLPGRRWRAATFCTFAVSPAVSLAGMRQALEERGAVVVAEGAFGPGARNIAENAAAFAERLLTAAWPGKRGTCS